MSYREEMQAENNQVRERYELAMERIESILL